VIDELTWHAGDELERSQDAHGTQCSQVQLTTRCAGTRKHCNEPVHITVQTQMVPRYSHPIVVLS